MHIRNNWINNQITKAFMQLGVIFIKLKNKQY